mgnify:CR=1 FL=1
MNSFVHKILVGLCTTAALGTSIAQTTTTAAGEAAPEASPHTLTGNLALVSDYRFRGISQSYRRPAVQGGFDYVHSSGFYVGTWNSSVSGNSYNNGASLEMDFYGGYRFEPIGGFTADVGVLSYYYPGAKLNSAPGTPTDQEYDTTELYFGLSSGSFSGKLSYAVTDYFGLDDETAGYAYWTSLPPKGDTKGTVYLDLNYNFDLGDKLVLGAHVGHLWVRHYGDLSYTDYKLSLTKEWAGLNLGLAIVGTDADKDFYQVGNSAWQSPRKFGATTAVVSIAKTF